MSNGRERPTVRVFFICAEAALNAPPSGDLLAGWWELKNIFHTVWMPGNRARNFILRDCSVYMQLTDGHGSFNLGLTVELLDFENPARNQLIWRSNPIVVQFPEPWAVVEESSILRELPFPRPGQYRFSICEGGQPLENGIVYIRVMPGDQP